LTRNIITRTAAPLFPERFLAAAGAVLFVLFPPASRAAERNLMSGGHVPAAVARLAPVGSLPASQRLNLAIGLPLRNPGGLDSLLQQLYDPASPNYRRYLTPEQFTERFGPTEQDYQALMDFARVNGLTVTATHPNRMVLDVAGAAADIARAFHLTLRVYQHPKEARTFYAPDVEPTVDFAVPILHISGLDNYALPHPNLVERPASASANATPHSGSGPGGFYQGSDFRTAYVPGTSLTGAGQSVGLLEFDGFYASDITTYESQTGLPNVPLTVVPVHGGIGTPGSGDVEVSLDIEMAISMAPGLSQVYVYEAPNNTSYFDSLLSRMANDNLSRQLSCSWGGGGPDATAEQIFQQMAAQGQSFFNASGDSDAFTGSIPFPSDSTNITEVGGTTLATGTGAAYSSETVWNWGGGQGSSGGISTYYAIPYYQQGLSMSANQGSTTMRNVPDVALTANDAYVVYGNGTSATNYGGTSFAAPLWAGFTALVNQQAAAAAQAPVGFLNPALYTIGKGANYAVAFHDTTAGNNFSSSSPSKFSAVAGYDLCTGWGTPNGASLINALATPVALIVSPVSGAAIGVAGGPFSITSGNFLLTNASGSSLTWSLVSTSAWLKISATNGTLAAAAQTNLACSLTATASNLAVGNYTANLTFSNWTAQVALAGLFTLQVNPPLVVSPTNGFAASGPVGGPFSVSSQNYSLTNQGGSSLPWGIINASSWLSASPSGGALAGGAQTTFTLSLTAAANSLASGIYTVAVLVTNPTGVAASLPFTIMVGQPIVSNGGFETGSFSGWTLNVSSKDQGSDYDTVTTSGAWVHSGSYGAELGPYHSLGYLYQTLTTSPGQNYLLSLWVDNPSSQSGAATPNQFLVQWNGTTLFNQNNMPYTPWTNLQFMVTATSATTVLQFGFEDPPGYLGLDDISVTPISPPAITVQPNSQAAIAGSQVNFQVTATGVAPLTYQWRFNGTSLAGASGASMTLTNVQAAQAGTYTVQVTNAFGSVLSSNATLTVLVRPAITTQPSNQTVLLGTNASFTVTATGTTPLAYQWTFGGAKLAGATANPLLLTSLQATQAGSYAVVVTNVAGSITSAVATLTVLVPPGITMQPSNQTVLVGTNASFTVTATGTAPLAYQWTFQGAKLAGATANPLLLTSLQATQAGSYAVVVTNVAGSITSAVATLTVLVPPGITMQPSNQTAVVGTNASFTVTATGTTPLAYQWTFGGAKLAGATANPLLLTGLQATQAGSYAVVVTNVAGSITSAIATLTVLVPPAITMQPSNQTAVVGTNASFAVTATGTAPLVYQWAFDGTNLAGATADTLLLTNVQPAQAGSYTVVLTNVVGVATSVVATLAVLVPPAITLQPSNQTAVVGMKPSITVTATGTAPLVYQWAFDGTNLAGATDDTLLLANVQPAQAGSYAVVITNVAGSVTSSVASLTVLPSGTVISFSLAEPTVSLAFPSDAGSNYVLEYKNTLDDPAWTPLYPPVTGTGAEMVLQDTNPPAISRYYRIRRE